MPHLFFELNKIKNPPPIKTMPRRNIRKEAIDMWAKP